MAASTTFAEIRIIVHPFVPEGELWGLPQDRIVYVHAATLERIKAVVWAHGRTLATITYAELMAALAQLRGQSSC